MFNNPIDKQQITKLAPTDVPGEFQAFHASFQREYSSTLWLHRNIYAFGKIDLNRKAPKGRKIKKSVIIMKTPSEKTCAEVSQKEYALNRPTTKQPQWRRCSAKNLHSHVDDTVFTIVTL